MSAARRLQAVPDQEQVEREEQMLVVNTATGEPMGTLAEILQPLRDQLAGAERDLNGWRTRHANLLRDREGEARESPIWPAAVRVFDYWRLQCRHPRSEWTLERFELIAPFLERSGTGKGKATKLTEDLILRNEEICKLAIDGIAFDPFISQRKNGTAQRHDGLHLIFGEKFEERCNAAPLERRREVFPPAPPSPQESLAT